MRVNKKRLQFYGLAVILVGVLFWGVCWAGGKVDPGVFKHQGTVFMIESDRIVIDDINYNYGAGTIFYSKGGAVIGSGYFAKGMPVGFEIDEYNGRKMIVRIGKIEKVK